MLTESDIEQFYRDLDSMKLLKPNAILKAASGLSSGNVSEYLNRKKRPSESFIKAFYEKVYKSSKITLSQKKADSFSVEKPQIIANKKIKRAYVEAFAAIH